jgi:hypothetical protein
MINLAVSGVYNLTIDPMEGPFNAMLIASDNGLLTFQSQTNLAYFIGVDESTYGTVWTTE